MNPVPAPNFQAPPSQPLARPTRPHTFVRYPIAVLIAFAIVIGVGFGFPKPPMVGVVAAVVVGLLGLVGAGIYASPKAYLGPVVWILIFLPSLGALTIGAGELGSQLALAQHGQVLTARVTNIHHYETTSKNGTQQHFDVSVAGVSDGADLGVVALTGDVGGLAVGTVTDVVVDPTGRAGTELATDLKPSTWIAVTAVGGALFLVTCWIGGATYRSRFARRTATINIGPSGSPPLR